MKEWIKHMTLNKSLHCQANYFDFYFIVETLRKMNQYHIDGYWQNKRTKKEEKNSNKS